jgi:hypothetical protein
LVPATALDVSARVDSTAPSLARGSGWVALTIEVKNSRSSVVRVHLTPLAPGLLSRQPRSDTDQPTATGVVNVPAIFGVRTARWWSNRETYYGRCSTPRSGPPARSCSRSSTTIPCRTSGSSQHRSRATTGTDRRTGNARLHHGCRTARVGAGLVEACAPGCDVDVFVGSCGEAVRIVCASETSCGESSTRNAPILAVEHE